MLTSTPVPQVTVDELAQALERGARLVDVREPDEYSAGHVPGARNVPLSELGARLAELRGPDPLYVICAVGGRSAAAAAALHGAGLEVRDVAGGTAAWMHSGRGVTTGTHV